MWKRSQLKITYVIFNLRAGRGGHSFSLEATIAGLADLPIDASIVEIANSDETLLSKYPNYKRIPINPLSILLSTLVRDLSETNFEVIHCFDDFSYVLVRAAYWGVNLPIVLTKCGGPNPRWYYPKASHLICYSEENYSYFQRRQIFDSLNLLPNRVMAKTVQPAERDQYLERYSLNVLCITRITRYYEQKISQSYELIKYLRRNGVDASITYIGKIEDQTLFQEMSGWADNDDTVYLFCDELHCSRAANYIQFFDSVVGSGRSFMEAAIEGKLMFVPAAGESLPILVTAENIDALFRANFSERSTSKSTFNLAFFVSEFIRSRESYTRFITDYAQRYFFVSAVVGEYWNLYNLVTSKSSRFRWIDTSLGYLYFYYRILSFKLGLSLPRKTKF